ncbi:DNA polymerase beta domain-containing protein [Paenibacillus sp. FSL R7-277]|uniref:aminoglycoside adenylyltransferase domain-containing protein n=1 Tax=Paenibacillus sp. FSL R7-277 TaxID=1227352 RepID=UPI0003E29D14|nr:aminoglycoside adenylyltransferase domain-containing protein [Paenibacillus sp. FSL R7-277]ETT67329.1 DNA polymerase beta domain-containing protein [Paenibacillus sp. FSL R7-277]
MEVLAYLDQAVDLFKEELGDNLSGIYLHGSLAMGCFQPDSSDIDLLIVIQDKLPAEVSHRLASRIVAYHDSLPNKRGIELSIVLKTYLHNYVYPTPFEFHFSEAHLERYRTDENYLCGGFEDADLAAHFAVVYDRGFILYGEPIREAFAPVDRGYYLDSIVRDVEDAPQKIENAPVYYTLNLCRVLYYVQEGHVSSKKEGGEWGLQHLPERYHGLLRRCLKEYSGAAVAEGYEPRELTDFAEFMMAEIKRTPN